MGTSRVQAQAASRFLGTITSVGADTLTVKTDAGEVRQVEVPSSAVLKRIAPGQRDLSSAADIQFSDLQTGDRVLVKLSADASGSTPQAAQIVTIKAADVAEKEQKDREDWQARGVGGLVKSVNGNDGTILVTSGAGTAVKTVTVHVSKTTVLKRYAPGSVRFDLAQPAPMDAIHPGDQLRARGEKSADGNEMQAEEVVSGSFRNISGTIVSVDAANTSLVVKDLLAKKNVTVHIPTDAQMHTLPDTMAKMLAARLKGATTGGSPTGQGPTGTSTGGNPMAAQQGGPARNGQPGAGRWAGRGQAQSGSMQQMLNRTPVIQFGDLKKGDAVMVVSTQGASEVTAITLLSGVEPLLEAPEASRNLLSNWSMGSGGSADEPAQ
ncbi:MAG: hypothetical protein WCA37_13995 [Terracidiphilus sp.]